jgi:hypothetical protein
MTENRIYKIKNELLYEGTIGCDCVKRNKCTGKCNYFRDTIKNWKQYRKEQYKYENKNYSLSE